MRLLTAAILSSTAATSALAASPCDALWGERTAIDKDADSCFRLERAIRAFGDAGCNYDELADVPHLAHQRADIADIQH